MRITFGEPTVPRAYFNAPVHNNAIIPVLCPNCKQQLVLASSPGRVKVECPKCNWWGWLQGGPR